MLTFIHAFGIRLLLGVDPINVCNLYCWAFATPNVYLFHVDLEHQTQLNITEERVRRELLIPKDYCLFCHASCGLSAFMQSNWFLLREMKVSSAKKKSSCHVICPSMFLCVCIFIYISSSMDFFLQYPGQRPLNNCIIYLYFFPSLENQT